MKTIRRKNSETKPHCWGKMVWVKKYEIGMVPSFAICNCEYGSLKCMLLTRQNKPINRSLSEVEVNPSTLAHFSSLRTF